MMFKDHKAHMISQKLIMRHNKELQRTTRGNSGLEIKTLGHIGLFRHIAYQTTFYENSAASSLAVKWHYSIFMKCITIIQNNAIKGVSTFN